MKRLTLELSDAAFSMVRREAGAHALCHTGVESLLATLGRRVVKAIEAGDEKLELKTRDERAAEAATEWADAEKPGSFMDGYRAGVEAKTKDGRRPSLPLAADDNDYSRGFRAGVLAQYGVGA